MEEFRLVVRLGVRTQLSLQQSLCTYTQEMFPGSCEWPAGFYEYLIWQVLTFNNCFLSFVRPFDDIVLKQRED